MSSTDSSTLKTPLREMRLRVAVFFTLIMMSHDSLNPVKVICEILNISTHWLTLGFTLTFISLIATNAKDFSYFSIKVFFHSIMSIFFSSIEVSIVYIQTLQYVIFTSTLG